MAHKRRGATGPAAGFCSIGPSIGVQLLLTGLWMIVSASASSPPAVVPAQSSIAPFDAREYPAGISLPDVDPASLDPFGTNPARADPRHGSRGQRLYAVFCAICHGRDGRGDGPSSLFCAIPPADFTRAEFKVRSTSSGALPTESDLTGVIRHGAGPDGAMPAFPFLRDEDLRELLMQIRRFSARWTQESVPTPLALPARIEGRGQRGARLYRAWGCGSCHGDAGRGDGRLAGTLGHARGFPDRPTDFARPRAFKAGRDEASLVRSILTGFNGTTMPGYSLPPGDESGVWDLAAYLRSLQRPEPDPPRAAPPSSTPSDHWRTPIPRQGTDLSAASCAACHPLQFLDWSRSRHAAAMGPGVSAQLRDQPTLATACSRCHAPLDEQAVSPLLSADGVSCSACHSRGGQKVGPPPTPTTLLPLVAQYPSPHGPVAARSFFEQSDFCAPCHQFRAGEAQLVDGSFLQNTVQEWRTSRAAAEGKSCQSCHMPDRRHFFRGIHDPETVRQGTRWTFDARTEGGRVIARMTLTNTGTGHRLPTYVVPEIWMRIELSDPAGAVRAFSERLIARKMAFAHGNWQELSDTRLRPDETATLDYAGPIPPGASTIVGRVVVVPDAWHEETFAAHLRDAPSQRSRRDYEMALTDARQSGYTLFRSERRLGP